MNLPLNIDFIQVLLHILNFVILAGGLTLILFKPICRFLDDRQAKYSEREKKLKEAEEKSEALRLEYEQKMKESTEQFTEMKKHAEEEWAATSEKYINDAKDKAAVIISNAEQEAKDRKRIILESAQTEISELVLTATQKLLSETVTEERNRELYNEFVKLADEKVSEERTTYDRK